MRPIRSLRNVESSFAQSAAAGDSAIAVKSATIGSLEVHGTAANDDASWLRDRLQPHLDECPRRQHRDRRCAATEYGAAVIDVRREWRAQDDAFGIRLEHGHAQCARQRNPLVQ